MATLSDLDRSLLAFGSQWWKRPGAKEQAIRSGTPSRWTWSQAASPARAVPAGLHLRRVGLQGPGAGEQPRSQVAYVSWTDEHFLLLHHTGCRMRR